jgi:hypothetical protein
MLKRNLVAVLILGLGAGAAQAESAYDSLPDASILPANVVQISPVVPAMGEHWADPATLPLGPIYCVHKGKIVCLEFMMSQEDYASGKSWPALAGIEGLPPVDHLNIGFEAHGHQGFEVPHYDIHMYFLSPEEVAKIQP